MINPRTPVPMPEISLEALLAVMPRLLRERAEELLPHLTAAMAEAELTTVWRQAAFLAQVGHESLDLTRWEEMGHRKGVAGCKACAHGGPHEAGAQYEGRKDLGNTQPGDGVRYKGRGPVQLTGRANYRAAGKALGVSLEIHPARAAEPEVGFRVAAWFWRSRGCNGLVDSGRFDAVTRRINGGLNGAEDRRKRYERALAVLRGEVAP